MSRNRTKATIIAFVLMLTIATMFVALPFANAQEVTPTTKKTFAYCDVIPNPVGVGQTCLLHLGITEPLQIGTDHWKGLTVIAEKPNNTTVTLGPYETDATGGTGAVFTPDIVGTWYLHTHFPAQWYNFSGFGIFGPINFKTLYQASDSEKLALVVQQQPIQYYPGFPLPTEYWTRPIDAQIREWWTISGSWLTTPNNLFAPWNQGPESAHVLWVKPLTTGGLAGGEFEEAGVSFETGDAYEGKWTGSIGPLAWLSSSIILAGKLYYQHYAPSAMGGPRALPVLYHCVDLRTGEELWSKIFLDNRTISFGQMFHWDSYNSHGVFPYLMVTTGGAGLFGPPTPENWYAFDPFTGDWQYTMENVPPGTNLYGPAGEIYRYNIDLTGGTISLWNQTEVVMRGLVPPGAGSWGNNANGFVHNASRGIMWTKNITKSLHGSVQAVFLKDRAIGADISVTKVNIWGLNLKPGHEGELMFNSTWTPPAYWAEGNVTVVPFGGGWVAQSIEDKVGVIWVKETREHFGFSLDTGQYLWGPTQPQQYLDALEDTPHESRAIAYGRLYCASVSGIVYCYNVTTGERLWSYAANDPYQEIFWSNNWWLKPLFITDGKVYVAHYEHSARDPRPRGAPMICLDAKTGDVIWRVNGMFRSTRWGGRAIIGDSVIATMDTYDQRVYAIGKGPSATTVSVQSDVVTNGSSVLIKGMVTDESPGVKDYARTARFPNGVPAIADDNMSAWMLYVYKQFPIPADATGVEVTLDAVDPNSNTIHIGKATSDMSGMFSYKWTPDKVGKYIIMATFEGSNSYYPSYAETALGVDPAPAPVEIPPVEIPAYPDYTPIFAGLAAIGIIAIVIGLVNLFWKRK